MNTDTLNNTTLPSDIPELVAQARAAYQQNRVKECLALTKALALADPGNTIAIELQNAVRSDLQRDLSDARGLLEESRNKPEGQKYRKAAEIILLKTLHLDPDNEGAKTLLSSVRSSIHTSAEAPQFQPEPTPAPAPALSLSTSLAIETPVAHAPIDVAVLERATRHESPKPEPVAFTTGTASTSVKNVKMDRSENKTHSMRTIPLIVVGIAILGGGLFVARQWLGTQNAVAAAAPARATSPSPALPTSDTLAAAVEPSAAAQARPLPETPEVPPPAAGAVSDPTTTTATRPAAETGSLAVSSSIPADIYAGEKYLGSTPTTLQLPAGNQTVEYRHGELRSVVTHVVKANETTTARITFDVVVQVNAKPWAQVFIDGAARLPLGQTPLSNVRVPLGSVLVFENPNFPSKSHTIALNDKTVQMIFQ